VPSLRFAGSASSVLASVQDTFRHSKGKQVPSQKKAPRIQTSFVETKSGRIHVACAGEGYPVQLLHQTPRSWDEYRDVLPMLGQSFRAIAMDTPGFGASDGLPGGQVSIEA
jgi:hypothetical protein